MAKRKRKQTNSLMGYQKGLLESAKGTMKLGIVSGVGMGTMGMLGSMGGVKNSVGMGGVTNAVGGALNLAAIGNMASIGMQVAKLPGTEMKKAKRKTKKLYNGW